jgi:Fur family peroxide stress response transcriptional regulator
VEARDHRGGPTSVQRLRASGLRATGARIAILEALEDDRRHPTAEMLFDSLRERFPSLSLSTVYATIDTFLEHGIIRQVSSRSGRLRVDGTPPDHDHAVCRKCGRVYDIDPAAIDRPTRLPALPGGLQVTNRYVEYEVICQQCRGA